MIAVDTSILLDIFTADKTYGLLCANILRHYMQQHSLCVCEVVFAETAAAFVASQIWRQYRKSDGKRHYMIPDFLVGAHAMKQCEGLITRDRGFFKQYFKSLNIINPTKE